MVTRAKKDMSDFMRGQGRVPFRPMPRRVLLLPWARCVTGVVATIRVRVVAVVLVVVVALLGPGMAVEDINYL